MTIKETHSPSCTKKPEIDYPCLWQYKVIGREQHLVIDAIKEICAPTAVTITYSHSSTSGKYHSFNAEIEVQDEAARIAIYRALHDHPAVKIVL